MDPLGKLSHMGIAKELEFGTAVAALDYLKFSSESLSLKIDELMDASIQAGQDEPPSYEGLGTIAGNTVHEAHPIGLGHFLRAWFGQPLTSTIDTGMYQHNYTPVTHLIPATRKGTADAGSTATTLVDAAQTWVVDQWAGWWIHVVTGTSAGTYRMIVSNDATTLTFATATAPDATSIYEIVAGPENSILPPYTIEVNRDVPGSTSAFQYKGMVANTLAFSIGVGAKILTLTAGWLGKDVANIAASTVVHATTEPFKWSQVKVGIGLNTSGVSLGIHSTTTLADTTKTWVVNEMAGKLLMKTAATLGQTEVRPIASNTSTVLTVSPAFIDAPIDTDTYKIFDCPDTVESLEFTLDNGVVALPTLNATKRVSRMVGDSFRTGSMTMTVIPQNVTDYASFYAAWATKEVLVWYKGDLITPATAKYNDLAFYFPKVLITAYPVNVGGPGRITVAIAAKMKYNSTVGYLVKSWLNNTRASYSA